MSSKGSRLHVFIVKDLNSCKMKIDAADHVGNRVANRSGCWERLGIHFEDRNRNMLQRPAA